MNNLLWGAPLILAIAACSGSVEIASSTGGSSGSGAGVGGGTSTAGSGGSGAGVGGGTTGAGGAGGSDPGCTLTMLHLDATVSPYNVALPECDMIGGKSVVWTGTGAVVKYQNGMLDIDQCSPAANCMPLITTVSVTGDKLSPSIPIGAYVKVSYALDPSWIYCTKRILIENVPAWDGLPNPVSMSNRIYVVGAERALVTFGSVPFVVDTVPLGCSMEQGCGGIKPDSYALIAAGTQVGMGQTKTITAQGRSFALHNLRSYQTSYCDDYWNWAFWAVEK